MFRRVSQMPEEEVFTRCLFGIILIAASFVSWGKWVTGILGVLFLFSAYQGVCLTCILYKKFIKKEKTP